MKLVWHIVKKDAWQQRYLIGGILVAAGVAAIPLRRFPVASAVASVALAVLGWLLVAALAHSEGLAGTSDHWLSRPVPTGKLLAAKISGVFLFVIVPLMVLQVAILFLAGFSISDYGVAMLNRTAMLVVTWVLPVFGLSAITRNWQQLGAGLVCVLALAASVTVLAGNEMRVEFWEAVQNGIFVAAGIVAIVIIVWQYRSRRVRAARVAAVVGLCASIIGPMQIAPSVYSAARRVASKTDEWNHGVRVVLDSTRAAQGIRHDQQGMDLVMIPLRVDGLSRGLQASISTPRIAQLLIAGRETDVFVGMTDTSDITLSNVDRYLLRSKVPMQLRVRAYITVRADVRRYEMAVLNGRLHTPETGKCESVVTDRLHVLCQRPYEFGATIRGFLTRGGSRPMNLQVFAEDSEPWPLKFNPVPFPLARSAGGLSIRSLDGGEEYRNASIVFEVSDVLARLEQDIVIDVPESARR